MTSSASDKTPKTTERRSAPTSRLARRMTKQSNPEHAKRKTEQEGLPKHGGFRGFRAFGIPSGRNFVYDGAGGLMGLRFKVQGFGV